MYFAAGLFGVKMFIVFLSWQKGPFLVTLSGKCELRENCSCYFESMRLQLSTSTFFSPSGCLDIGFPETVVVKSRVK